MHHLIGVSSDNKFFGQGEVAPEDEMERFNEEVHCYTFNGYESPRVPDVQSCSNFQRRLI